MLNILIDPSAQRKIADFRTLGLSDIMVLGRYHYAQARRALSHHTHGDMFEICLLDEGEQPYVVEGRRYLLRGGDLLLVLPNERHGTGPAPENRGRLYWLLIRVPRRGERFLNLPPAVGRSLVDALLRAPQRHFSGRPQLKACLERMFAVFDNPQSPFRIAELQNWALRFVLDVLHDARRHAERPIHAAIRKVQAAVEERLSDEALSVSDLAAVAGLSVSHFKAQFKREVGSAPGNYVTLRRVARAKERLSTSREPVTAIALDTGFRTSQYFATAFKKHTGLTPLAYRLQARRRTGRGAPSSSGAEIL